MMITLSRSTLISISVLLFILSPILSRQETAGPNAAYVIICFLFSVFSVLCQSVKLEIKIHHFLAFFVWVLAVVSTALSSYIYIDVNIFKYLFLVLIYVLLSSRRLSAKDVCVIAKCYLAVAVVLVSLVVLSFLLGFPHNESEFFISRYSIGITGLYKNPNYVMSFIAVAQYVLYYFLLCAKQSLKMKVILLVVLMSMLFAVFLSGTRAALFNTICSILICMCFYLQKNKYNLFKFVGIVILLMVLLWIFAGGWIKNFILLYFESKDLLSDTSRTDSWMFILKKYIEHPILGNGLGSTIFFLHFTSYLEYLHNIYLEILSEQGIVGLLCFVAILFSGFRKVNPRDRNFIWGFLFVTAFPLMFQNGFAEVNFWRFLLLNRLLVDYSNYSKEGFVNTVSNCISQPRVGIIVK